MLLRVVTILTNVPCGSVPCKGCLFTQCDICHVAHFHAEGCLFTQRDICHVAHAKDVTTATLKLSALLSCSPFAFCIVCLVLSQDTHEFYRDDHILCFQPTAQN